MLKSYWWGVCRRPCGDVQAGWMAHVILVSAQGPNPSFFFFGGTFIRLGSLLGQGLGPGLDNTANFSKIKGFNAQFWSGLKDYRNRRLGLKLGLDNKTSILLNKMFYS